MLNFRDEHARREGQDEKHPQRVRLHRAQPATMSRVEVVTKAKAAGLKFTNQLVYEVRKRSKRPMRPREHPLDPKSKSGFVRRMKSLTDSENERRSQATGLSCLALAVLRLGTVEKEEGIVVRTFAHVEWNRSPISAGYAVLGISGVMRSSGLCGVAYRIDAEQRWMLVSGD